MEASFCAVEVELVHWGSWGSEGAVRSGLARILLMQVLSATLNGNLISCSPPEGIGPNVEGSSMIPYPGDETVLNRKILPFRCCLLMLHIQPECMQTADSG